MEDDCRVNGSEQRQIQKGEMPCFSCIYLICVLGNVSMPFSKSSLRNASYSFPLTIHVSLSLHICCYLLLLCREWAWYYLLINSFPIFLFLNYVCLQRLWFFFRLFQKAIVKCVHCLRYFRSPYSHSFPLTSHIFYLFTFIVIYFIIQRGHVNTRETDITTCDSFYQLLR
jgi:hypothetical protein